MVSEGVAHPKNLSSSEFAECSTLDSATQAANVSRALDYREGNGTRVHRTRRTTDISM